LNNLLAEALTDGEGERASFPCSPRPAPSDSSSGGSDDRLKIRAAADRAVAQRHDITERMRAEENLGPARKKTWPCAKRCRI
jgi:hypothetical protein